jgi:hypothetical protein
VVSAVAVAAAAATTTALEGAIVVALAAATAPPLLEELYRMIAAPDPVVMAAAVAVSMMQPRENRHLFPPLLLQLLRYKRQAALPLCSGKRAGRGRQLNQLSPAVAAVKGHPRLHPTKNLPIPAVNTIHMFSAQSKLCFVRDWLSGKDFLVDTGATLSLLPLQSAAAATGPKLQSVKGQQIKKWNFGNTRVEFNGWEIKLAFLQADVLY